jgi:hypothetical protein
MRSILLAAALVISQSVAAEDAIPLIELNTKVYCTELVSKMLDKAEQQVEKDKCLADEAALKRKIKPLWHLTPKSTQEQLITKHFKEERHHTYVTVANYVRGGVGSACVDGRMDCKPQTSNTDEQFALLRSDFYCYAKMASVEEARRPVELKDCIAAEEHLKAQLAPFWHAVHPRTQSYCSQFFLTMERSPFGTLTNCVASDIGHHCLAGTLDCRLKE